MTGRPPLPPAHCRRPLHTILCNEPPPLLEFSLPRQPILLGGQQSVLLLAAPFSCKTLHLPQCETPSDPGSSGQPVEELRAGTVQAGFSGSSVLAAPGWVRSGAFQQLQQPAEGGRESMAGDGAAGGGRRGGTTGRRRAAPPGPNPEHSALCCLQRRLLDDLRGSGPLQAAV